MNHKTKTPFSAFTAYQLITIANYALKNETIIIKPGPMNLHPSYVGDAVSRNIVSARERPQFLLLLLVELLMADL